VTEDEEQEQPKKIAGCSRNLHLHQLATGAFLFTQLLHFLSLSLSPQHLQLPNARRHCINKCTKQRSALAQQRTQQSRRRASEHERFST
jgi:hypothetical protein